MKTALLAFLAVILCAPAARAAVSYAGEWEYQALNAGDTSFKVEHEGSKITFYRVLHPEFEGQRYKLEHIYRGELAGERIHGKMFVREEGMADFEFLRDFDGQILDADRMKMDEMPLKRIRAAAPAPAPAEPPPPKYTKVVIKRKPQPEPEPDAAAEAPGGGSPDEAGQVASTAQAPASIPQLIPVGRRIETPRGREVRALLDEGDARYAAKDYAGATEKFAAALKLDALKVELLYKLGLCHGILGSRAARKKQSKVAAGHYHQAIGFWQRAVRYDPYNAGAKENIRRAELKLKSL
ncbi:MAG: hypothetical protein JXR96_14540 [Deltaproteobacteria bacterium]|nr:hypothetical protein [Deltaproteobacteria bacterium]